jgi:DNA-binding FrmR family transcriptional regulator
MVKREQTAKEDALKRLAYIEGHLKAIRKMVENDVYCVDILKQTYAVQRALDKFEGVVLRGHLQSCVPTGIREGRDAVIIDELEQLFDLSRR